MAVFLVSVGLVFALALGAAAWWLALAILDAYDGSNDPVALAIENRALTAVLAIQQVRYDTVQAMRVAAGQGGIGPLR